MIYSLSKGGAPFEIDIKNTLEETPLSNTTGFRTYTNLLSRKILDSIDEDLFDRNSLLIITAKAISEFTGVDLSDLLETDISNILDPNGEVRIDVLDTFIKALDKFDVDSLENSLFGLLAIIQARIKGYKYSFKNEDNCEFDYTYQTKSGKVTKTFEVPFVIKVSFSNTKTFTHFNVNQAVEILQIKKQLAKFKKSNPVSLLNADNVMSHDYSAFLNIVALSVIEKGKPIESDDSKFTAQIEDRMTIFKDINTQLAYDIGFFLTSIIRN